MKAETVLSLYVNEQSGSVGVAMVNLEGKEVYKNLLEFFFNASIAVKDKRDLEIKNFFEFIRNRTPEVIVISGNSPRAISLKASIASQFKNICKQIICVDHKILSCYASIVAKIPTFKDQEIFLAAKQAKLLYNRLPEICLLWAQEEQILLDCEFHNLQRKVDKRTLRQRFEQVLQDRVCEEGVDFRLFQTDKQLFASQLQLLPGFGAKKTSFFMKKLANLGKIKEISSHEKLLQLQLLLPNQARNSLSFLRFFSSKNILDSTSIHPSHHFILKELAKLPSASDERFMDFVRDPSFLDRIESNKLECAKSLETRYCRPNIIAIINVLVSKLSDQRRKVSTTAPTAPIPSLSQLFSMVYNVKKLEVQQGAKLTFIFREQTDNFYEFTSKEFKFRARLPKSEALKQVGIDRWIEKKKHLSVELLIESIRAFKDENEGQTQIDLIFDNQLTLNYPNYLLLASQFYPKTTFSLSVDPSNFPSTKETLIDQFNIFGKQMTSNPANVIDLTDENPYASFSKQVNIFQFIPNSSRNDLSDQPSSNQQPHSSSGDRWAAPKQPQIGVRWNSQKTDETPQQIKSCQNASSEWSSWEQQPSVSISGNESKSTWGGESKATMSSDSAGNSGSTWGDETKKQSSQVSAVWGKTTTSDSWGANSTSDGWGQTSVTTQESKIASALTSSDGWGGSSATTSEGWGGGSSRNNTGAAENNQNSQSRSGGSRSCFKCNKEGHISRNCTEPSNRSGPSGSGNTGVCYKCNEENHLARDCPNAPARKSGCFKCGEEGHMSRDCTNPQTTSNSNRNSQGGAGGSRACFKCGDEGHMSRECTNPNQQSSQPSRECFKCKQTGHISRECPNQTGPPPPSKCFNCNEDGHMSRECPKPAKKRDCYNCGQEGHMSKDCTQERKERTNRTTNSSYQKDNGRQNSAQTGSWDNSCSTDWSDSTKSQWGNQNDSSAQQTSLGASCSSNGWGTSTTSENKPPATSFDQLRDASINSFSSTSVGWGTITNNENIQAANSSAQNIVRLQPPSSTSWGITSTTNEDWGSTRTSNEDWGSTSTSNGDQGCKGGNQNKSSFHKEIRGNSGW